MGNFGVFGDALPTAKQFISGLGLSIATGGMIQGVNASLHGRSFLTGKLPMPEVRPMPALPFTTPEAKLNTDGMRTQLKDMPSSVEKGSGSTLSLPKPEMNEVNFVSQSERLAQNRALGIAGENAVGTTGPKTAIQVAGRTRIPDALTSRTLTEVKNVKSLSFTSQLRDFHTFSQQKGLDFILYTRPNTTFSAPLQNAVNQGTIIHKFIP